MAPRSERVQEFCPWCGQPLRRVMVHGEIRCGSCHMPVDVCCEGAPLREHEVPFCPIPPEPPARVEGGGAPARRPEGGEPSRPAEHRSGEQPDGGHEAMAPAARPRRGRS